MQSATDDEELRLQLAKLGRYKLELLAKALAVRGFKRKKTPRLVHAIVERYDRDTIQAALAKISPAPAQRLTWWTTYHNHVYGIFTVLGVAISLAVYFWPSSPLIPVERVQPFRIGVRTVDNSGNILNAANTTLLEYVLYREDEQRQWQYLQTTKASSEEYTYVGASKPGIYNIEAYDLGIFLGTAADIVAKSDVKLTISAPKRTPVRVRVLREDATPAVGVRVDMLNGRIQDKPMLSSRTNERGEAVFELWPTSVVQEHYSIQVTDGSKELHRTGPIKVGQRAEMISLTIGADGGREAPR